MRGLLVGEGLLDVFQIARYYGYWIDSSPFSIKETTSHGLSPLSEVRDDPDPELAYAAARENEGAESLSNGCMMRVTPLAVWGRNLSIVDLE